MATRDAVAFKAHPGQHVAAKRLHQSEAFARGARRRDLRTDCAAGQSAGRRQGYSAGFQDGSGKYKAAVDAYTKLTKSLQQQTKAGKPAKP